MEPKTTTPSLGQTWAPYVPSEKEPWNLRRVVHLHRRAGFAATWSEIQRDLKDGPQASVDRVLAGKAATEGVPAEFQKTADAAGRVGRHLGRSRTAQGVVGLPHALRTRPADRAAGAHVAQPLRHQQPQGRGPRRSCGGRTNCSASSAVGRSANC